MSVFWQILGDFLKEKKNGFLAKKIAFQPTVKLTVTRAKKCEQGAWVVLRLCGYQEFYLLPQKLGFLAHKRPNLGQNWHFWPKSTFLAKIGIFGPFGHSAKLFWAG